MKNILFDLYGTLIDVKTDEESAAFWQGISKILLRKKEDGEELKERYVSLCRSEKSQLPPMGEIDLVRVFQTMLADCGLPHAKEDAQAFATRFRKLSLKRLKCFSGTKKMLSSLKRAGAGVYLLSNAQSCFTETEIEQCGLAPYFDGVLLSSAAGWKKPSPQFFGAAFSRFSLTPEACLYAGNDLFDDVGGAHGVGMKCVYIQSPQSGKYENPPVPDYVARNRKQLTKILIDWVK